jgi:hypothetical protein
MKLPGWEPSRTTQKLAPIFCIGILKATLYDTGNTKSNGTASKIDIFVTLYS